MRKINVGCACNNDAIHMWSRSAKGIHTLALFTVIIQSNGTVFSVAMLILYSVPQSIVRNLDPHMYTQYTQCQFILLEEDSNLYTHLVSSTTKTIS